MATKNVTIILKSGLADDVSTLILAPNEPAVTTDTHKIYVGDSTGAPILLNPSSVSEADKLSTPRTIGLSGDVTGSAQFDGSANTAITTTLSNSGVTPGTYDAVTVDIKGRVTSGSTPTYAASKAVGTDNTGKLISIDEVSTGELKQLVGIDTSKTIQDQFDDLSEALDDYVEIINLPKAISDVTLTQSTSAASITVTEVDTTTGTSNSDTTNFQVASTTQIGLMPKEAYSQLQQVTADVEILKGATKRFVISLGNNTSPNQTQLQDAYEDASGGTGEAPDGTTLFDADNSIEYRWFETLGEWVQISAPTVGLATNEAAGIVMGDDITGGKIFVETDGTMSLNGYDGLVQNTTTVAGKPLSSNVTLETLTIKDDTDIIGTYNPSTSKSIDIGPTIESYIDAYSMAIADSLSGKVDKVTTATSGNLVTFGSAGAITDSAIPASNLIFNGDILNGGTFGE